MTFLQIQNDIIKKYRIDLCDGTKCDDGDWSRTRAPEKAARLQMEASKLVFVNLYAIARSRTHRSKHKQNAPLRRGVLCDGMGNQAMRILRLKSAAKNR